MIATGDSDEDAFGIPARVIKLPEEFYASLGRIVALGAVVELRMSDVVELWGRSDSLRGAPRSQLAKRFKAIARERQASGLEFPLGLKAAFGAAEQAMDERNVVVHSLWPNAQFGWRNRRPRSVVTARVGLESLGECIRMLVSASDGFIPYLRTPID